MISILYQLFQFWFDIKNDGLFLKSTYMTILRKQNNVCLDS